MDKINHINYCTNEQEVYCCLRNRVVRLDDNHKADFCSGCKMLNGYADGAGVECLWEDMREVGNPHHVTDPYKEWASNQNRKVTSLSSWGNALFVETL